MKSTTCWALAFLLVLSAAGVGHATVGAPLAVSPGRPDSVPTIDARCPTFSWAGTPAAVGYELVIYRLSPDLETGASGSELEASMGGVEPIIRVKLPAGTSSWTPSGEQCLAGGERYAWSVGAALASGATRWSGGRAFEVERLVRLSHLEAAIDEAFERLLQAEADLLRGGGRLGRTLGSALSEARLSERGAAEPVARAPAAPLAGDRSLYVVAPSALGDIYGLVGEADSTDEDSAGVAGEITTLTGAAAGVAGVTQSDEGVGVRGVAANENSSASGEYAAGVVGIGLSPTSAGVFGSSESLTGATAGVVGESQSPDGFAGFFIHSDGGYLLGATKDATDLSVLEFWVDSDGNVSLAGALGLAPTDAPPTCNAEHHGWIYYDDSLEELCACHETTGWRQVDGGGSC